ncbi:MAG: Mth938-like domain-containing protein [Burkholderiaceae bacterium]|nr:Mth938-like domain-containing protein [Burkholderiaceae bacterium]
MKLHQDPRTSLNTVTAYGPGFIEINAVRFTGNLIFSPDRPASPWSPSSFETLAAGDFEALLALEPEIVLIGTGSRQRFPRPALYAALTRARIGVEVMDTPAACRTYNILTAEGRRVVAAVLQDA